MTDRDDWLAWRREGIGASDIAAICGLSHFDSPLSIYMEKRGEIPPKDLDGNMAVQFGKRLEPIMPAWFHDDTGLYVAGEQTWCVNPELDWMRATVDGFVVEGPSSGIEDALGVYEAKVTGLGVWDDEIPEQYQIQGQWQMAVTGLERLWFAVAHRASPAFRVYEMARDDGVIAELTRLGGEFWNRVQAGTPPPIDALPATSTALAAAYPESIDAEATIDGSLIGRYRIAKGRVEAAELDLKQAENEIKAALGDAGIGVDADGHKVVTWKSQSRAGVDAKRLKAEHPDLAKLYATTSSFRVLRVGAER